MDILNTESFIQNIQKLSNDLADRSKELDERENRLNRESTELEELKSMYQKEVENLELEKIKLTEELEVIRKKMSSRGRLSDRVIIDAGGTIVHTSRRTMCKYPGTPLYNMFSGDGDDILLDEDGIYYLDVDPDMFLQLMKFLRSSHNLIPFGDSFFNSMLDEFGIVSFEQHSSMEKIHVRNLNKFIDNIRFDKDSVTYLGNNEYSNGVVVWTLMTDNPENIFVGVKPRKGSEAFGWVYQTDGDIIEVSKNTTLSPLESEAETNKLHIITVQLDCDTNRLILYNNSHISMQSVGKKTGFKLIYNTSSIVMLKLVKFYHVLPAITGSKHNDREEVTVYTNEEIEIGDI